MGFDLGNLILGIEIRNINSDYHLRETKAFVRLGQSVDLGLIPMLQKSDINVLIVKSHTKNSFDSSFKTSMHSFLLLGNEALLFK